MVEVCRKHEISEQTYYRWRHRFGVMTVEEVRRLREVERENARFERLVAEQKLQISAIGEPRQDRRDSQILDTRSMYNCDYPVTPLAG